MTTIEQDAEAYFQTWKPEDAQPEEAENEEAIAVIMQRFAHLMPESKLL
jgi:hypothetical protein